MYTHVSLFVHVQTRMLKMCENYAIGRFRPRWTSIPYQNKLDKLMLLPQSTPCSERVADFDP